MDRVSLYIDLLAVLVGFAKHNHFPKVEITYHLGTIELLLVKPFKSFLNENLLTINLMHNTIGDGGAF